MKLHTALSALGVLAVLVTPVFAQPFPPPYNYDFELEVQCSTGATSACPLVGPFTNLLTDGTQDWLSDANGTGSSNTGPTANGGADHNPGIAGGFYLYTETSGGAPTGTPIELLSPLLDRTGVSLGRIRFWYHMFGSSMGTMHVDLVDVINTGADGITTTGATFASASATFTAADVGDTITISGSTMGNDGVYMITMFNSANSVDVSPPFVIVENSLSYSHERKTVDFVPGFTDNIDLWQELSVSVPASAFAGTGNSNAFAVIIRSLRGASFASDMAIDDFTYDIPPSADTGVISIDSPSGSVATGMYPVMVTIENFGLAPQSNIPLDLVVDGGTPISEAYAPILAPGATASYTFTATADLTVGGPHTIQSYTTLAGDGDPTNDGVTSTLTSLATITSFPYLQDFEAGMGNWMNGGTNDSWAFGTPAKTVINGDATPGLMGLGSCWTTGGLTGNYNPSEQSFVAGPIFDFSGIAYPWIDLSVWWQSEFSWDGAVIQTSIDFGMSWQNVGAFGDPNNWYTDNTINGAPGGSQEGWSGRVSSGNGSGMWVTAQHDLFDLAGQPSVLLRIAFGSDGSVHDEGFAFDDLSIYDNGPTYPGTPNSGLQLGTGVNGPPTSYTGLGEEVKTATALDLINLLVSSPTGTYDFQPLALVAQPFPTGTTPGGVFPPPIYIDTTLPFVILIGIEPFLTQTLIPGGVGYSATMPFGFVGQSFMFQAVCVTPAFAITDGYEIQVL